MKIKLNKTSVSDTITKTIQSSLPNTVTITDAVGVEITLSRNAIVTNTCINRFKEYIHRWFISQMVVSYSICFGLGPCKLSGWCGILGNGVPFCTVDHLLRRSKVSSYRSADNVMARSYTVYLSICVICIFVYYLYICLSLCIFVYLW